MTEKYFVYIIRSKKTGALYKGHTEDLEKRLKQHNSGSTRSTSPGIPWELVWQEEHASLESAISREKYLKSSAGRRFVKFKLSLPPLTP